MSSITITPRLPSAFRCPITDEPLQDPVLARDGYTYERSAFEQFQAQYGKEVSPKTGRPMAPLPAVPNAILRRTLHDFLQQSSPNFPTDHCGDWRGNLLCPVGLDTMQRPVRLSDAVDYDVPHATDVLTLYGRSPVQQLPFTVDPPIPDRAMQALALELGELGELTLGHPDLAYPETFPPPRELTDPERLALAAGEAAQLVGVIRDAMTIRALPVADQALTRLLEIDRLAGLAALRDAHRGSMIMFYVCAGLILVHEQTHLSLSGHLRLSGSLLLSPDLFEIASGQLARLQWLTGRLILHGCAGPWANETVAVATFLAGRQTLGAWDTSWITRHYSPISILARRFVTAGIAFYLYKQNMMTSVWAGGLPLINIVQADIGLRCRRVRACLTTPLVNEWHGVSNASPWPRLQAHPVQARLLAGAARATEIAGLMVTLALVTASDSQRWVYRQHVTAVLTGVTVGAIYAATGVDVFESAWRLARGAAATSLRAGGRLLWPRAHVA